MVLGRFINRRGFDGWSEPAADGLFGSLRALVGSPQRAVLAAAVMIRYLPEPQDALYRKSSPQAVTSGRPWQPVRQFSASPRCARAEAPGLSRGVPRSGFGGPMPALVPLRPERPVRGELPRGVGLGRHTADLRALG